MTLVIPMVTWRDAREEWVVDIYSRLLQDRIIFLGTPIDEQIANLVVAELLHLESEQSDRDIAIYVNSPGGSVSAGLMICDTMRFVRPDVQTMCVGSAMGMGALIVLGGASGKRVALPHAKILLKQVSGGFEGEVTTSRSKRGRCSRSGAGSRRSSPSTPASRSRRSRATSSVTTT